MDKTFIYKDEVHSIEEIDSNFYLVDLKTREQTKLEFELNQAHRIKRMSFAKIEDGHLFVRINGEFHDMNRYVSDYPTFSIVYDYETREIESTYYSNRDSYF